MAKDFLGMVTELLLSERLGEELEKNAPYKEAVAEEARIYELLNSSLNEEQQNMLKEYFDASSSRESIIEDFVYKQGMKDLLSLFRSLSPEGESKLLRISGEHAAK
mgnify:CR=1 FL=1